MSSWSFANTSTALRCMRSWPSGPRSTTQPPNTYGGMSVGAVPRDRVITMNLVSRNDSSRTTKGTSGTGTVVRSPTSRITLACISMS